MTIVKPALSAALALSVACGAPQSPAEALVVAPVTDAAAPVVTAPSSDYVDRRPLVFTKTESGTRLTDTAIVVDGPVVFAVGSARLLRESDAALDAIAEIMRASPTVTVEVQAHTDNLGAAAYNLTLSQARAEAVKQAIERRGVDGARLTARGYGQTEPLVPNDTPEHRVLNRRIVLVRTDKR